VNALGAERQKYYNTEQDKFLALPEWEVCKEVGEQLTTSHTETGLKQPGEILSSLTIRPYSGKVLPANYMITTWRASWPQPIL
jgi:hypothetical protein